MRTYYISSAAGVLAVVVLIAAGIFSVERARADFAFRSHSAAAIEMQPANTEYLMFRALQVEYEGGDPRPLLKRAAELNPLNSAPRIRLGLDAEVRGDYAVAEKWLLDAARIDRQFEPRWTLANFYFRRENAPEFWKWMRQALEVSYGDRRPAFELCWQMSANANEIFSRAMPERPEVLAAYLGWILETHRTQAIGQVAIKLAANQGYRALVLGADDAELEAGDGSGATALWSALGLAVPDGVYRGNFERGAIGHGFDWHINEISGVVHTDIDQPRSMHRISFDGRQPESCELLSQKLSLEKGRRYRLRWNSAVNEIQMPTGIEWRIGDAHASVANSAGEMEFVAPSDLTDLKFIYQRPSGEARTEGSVELWGVAIRRE